MTEATRLIVEKLNSLGETDREWILRKLSADERQQVLTTLSSEGAADSRLSSSDQGNGGGRDTDATGRAERAPAAEFADLDDAEPEQIAALLANETDWILMVLLGFRHWSWTEDFLRLLSPARIRSLRELSSEVGERVRPRVRETVIRMVADRLRDSRNANGRRSLFDALLERAERAKQVGKGGGSA